MRKHANTSTKIILQKLLRLIPIIMLCYISISIILVCVRSKTSKPADKNHVVKNDFYSVSISKFQDENVSILYPEISIYNNETESNEINNTIKEIMFAGETEKSIENYKGVLMIQSDYEITYSDGRLISLCMCIQVTKGMQTASYSKGLTFSIDKRRMLCLNDIGVSAEQLVSLVNSGNFVPSRIVQMRIEHEETYNIDELVAVNTKKYDNFYLLLNSVVIIVDNTQSTNKTGSVEVPVCWR